MNSDRDMFGSEEPTYIGKSSAPIYQEPQNVWALAWRVINSKRLVNVLMLVGIANLNYLAMTEGKKDEIRDFIVKSYYRMNMDEMFLKESDGVERLDKIFEKHKIPVPEPYVYASENEKVEELLNIVKRMERLEALRMKPSQPGVPKKKPSTKVRPIKRPRVSREKEILDEIKTLRAKDDPINEERIRVLIESLDEYLDEKRIQRRP